MLPTIPYPKDNAREWAEIIAFYERLPDTPYAVAMERLTRRLYDAGFVAAGLHGTTSMFSLVLGLTSDVLNNPHLDICSADGGVRLTYDDGSKTPWSVQVGYDELCDRVERFLIKRARWFRDTSG